MDKTLRETAFKPKRPQVRRRRGPWRRLAVLAAGAAVALAANASDVFLLPDSNILWRTAPSADFEVPVFLPKGASSATLVVSGRNYSREYAGIQDGMFPVSLPAQASGGEETYELALSFDGAPDASCNAKIAVVRGVSTGSQAEAYVRSAGSYGWNHATAENVLLPIPSGVDALYVNGVAADDELYDAPGWFSFKAQAGTTYDMILAGGGAVVAEATLFGVSTGFKIFVK